jgi:general secretion pathway protein A
LRRSASSGGTPRIISVICDNALVAAFALDRRPVDADVVAEVCRDLDLETNEPTSSKPEAAAAPKAAPGPTGVAQAKLGRVAV